MQRSFKCAYCGRKIKSEICPYCGGVNELPEEPQPYIPSVSPNEGRFATDMSKHAILRNTLSFAILIAVVFVIIFFTYIVNKDDYEVISTDNYIECESDFNLSISALNKTFEFTLPCRYDDLEKELSLTPPKINDPVSDDPNSDGILDLKPSYATFTQDVYKLLKFDLVNDSNEMKPYTDSKCDRIASDYCSRMTSLCFLGKELLVDLDSLKELFGEPTNTYIYSSFTTVEWLTSYGALKLHYQDDDPSRPSYVEFENCRQGRQYRVSLL